MSIEAIRNFRQAAFRHDAAFLDEDRTCGEGFRPGEFVGTKIWSWGKSGSCMSVVRELRGGRWSGRPRSPLPAPLCSVPALAAVPAAEQQLRCTFCASAEPSPD